MTISEIMASYGMARVGDSRPATIIVPSPQVSLERDLAIGVGAYGRRATLHNALSEVASFGLSRAEAVATAQAMQRKVKTNWEKLCRKNAFTAAEIERLHTCFIACDEKVDRTDRDRT